MKEGTPPKVSATSDHPVNRGEACPKGFQFLAYLNAPTRAWTPYLRSNADGLEPIDWDEALAIFVDPYSRQPAYKSAAAAIRPSELDSVNGVERHHQTAFPCDNSRHADTPVASASTTTVTKEGQ